MAVKKLRVLLRRNYRTPLGKFAQSSNGVPTEIPEVVRDRYGLPKDAVIVGDDYQTPEELAEEAKYSMPDTVEMTAAQQEAEINRRVNEILAEREKEKASKKAVEDHKKQAQETDGVKVDPLDPETSEEPEPEPEGTDAEPEPEFDAEILLGMSVKGVVKELPELEYEQLAELLAKEEQGQNRVSLKKAIEDEMDAFDGEEEEDEEAA